MAAPFGPPWALTALHPGNPVLGQPYVLTFAAGSFYHVLMAEVTFTTGAAVAARQFICYYQDPTGTIFGISPALPSQAASLSYTYDLGPNFALSALLPNSELTLPLPDLVVPETWSFALDCRNRQAGDQFGSISIFYESLAYV